MKTFVIYAESCVERKHLVDRIIEITGGTIFPAIILPNRVEGCATSHFNVYNLSDEDVLVFEDDCEIIDESFLSLLEQKSLYDIMYIGVNAILPRGGSYGTHAMYISQYAKNCFLEYNADKKIPVDHVWNQVEQKYKLRVFRPNPVDRYVIQKLGLKSLITGKTREKYMLTK